jgi:hypothetical protein
VVTVTDQPADASVTEQSAQTGADTEASTTAADSTTPAADSSTPAADTSGAAPDPVGPADPATGGATGPTDPATGGTTRPADPATGSATGSATAPAGPGMPAAPAPAPSGLPVTGGSAVQPGPTVPATDYTDAGVPTLDYLQDKVEKRYATSLGSTELAQGTAAGKSLAEQRAERDRLAAEKLEQLRKSLHPDG